MPTCFMFLTPPYLVARSATDAVLVNNLSFEIPQTRSDVEALGSTLETIGFKVISYKDFNVQVRSLDQFTIESVLNPKPSDLAILCKFGLQNLEKM